MKNVSVLFHTFIAVSSIFLTSALAFPSYAAFVTLRSSKQIPINPGGRPRGDDTRTGRSGPCSPDQVIIPVTLREQQGEHLVLHWGKTTEDSPTVWFYIPYESVTYARFIVTSWTEAEQQSNLAPIYDTPISVPSETPGIIRIQIPPDLLEVDQWYEAKLEISVICRPGVPAEPEYASAWILREVEPEFGYRPQTETLLERAILYAEQGFWYDALSTLTATGVVNSDEWMSLLRQFNLAEEIVTAPVVDCCTPVNP